MQRYRFPIAVATTALALVLIAIGVGGLVVNNALASSPIGAFAGGPWHAGGPRGGGWNHDAIPSEIAGLADVPADQRFSHFRGARVQLTDKNNQPLNVEVTPGTAAICVRSICPRCSASFARTFNRKQSSPAT